MHRRYIPGGNYEGWRFAPVNRINNIDYITSSCTNWCIKEEHLYGVNKLEEFDHVKSVCLEFNSQTDQQIPQTLNALAQKLSINNTIDRLFINDQSTDVNFPVSDSLVNVLRALTSRPCALVRLEIKLAFAPSLHRSLTELLATKTSIRTLSLNLIDLPRENFKAIIGALTRSNISLKKIVFENITDYQSEVVDLSLDIIQRFKLKSFRWSPPAELNKSEYESQFMALQDQGYEVTIVEGLTVIVFETPKGQYFPAVETHPQVVNDEHQTNVIGTLPKDMLQSILNGLNIKSLLSFKRVDKKFQMWMRTSTFWREYYLCKAHTVPTDILTAADLLYGSYIAQNRAVSFWECINIALAGTLLRRDVEYHSLNPFHEECVAKLLQTYPELRMMESFFRRFAANGDRYRYDYRKKWSGARLSFYLLGSSNVVYHLNIDMNRPDAVGVRFLQGEISRAESESDPTPRAIFDSFVSRSIDEVIIRVRPMVEAMIVSMRSAHSYVYRNLFLDKFVDCKALPSIHYPCMAAISTTFDRYAKVFVDQLQLKINGFDAVKEVIEQFSKHVSSVSVDHVTTEYDLLHHRVDRTAYNKLYKIRLDDGTSSYWNFDQSALATAPIQNTGNAVNRKENSKKKERFKKTPHVALICLFRKVLNLVMLPVLKSLWLRNLNDVHVDWYHFDKYYANGYDYTNTPLRDWYDYYYAKHQPLESVTVSHAKPSSWPMSAVAVGKILTPFICEAVISVVRDNWIGSSSGDGTEKVEELIRMIEQYDIFSSKSHIEAIRKAIQ